MRNYYFIIVIFYSFFLNAQIVNIPDANFKAKLLQANLYLPIASGEVLANIKIDINDNGEIEESEALLVFGLNVDNSNINDLTGLEYFINLRNLNVSNNNINQIDLSQFLNLETLFSNSTPLTTIDVTQNTNLKNLALEETLISSIDLSNNLFLENLMLRSCLFINIDLSSSVLLKNLDISNNSISHLDISQNPLLQQLICNNCSLSFLEVSNNLNLKHLEFENNQISNIDLSQIGQLENLYCSNNNISNLDLTQNHQLFNLYCSNNNISNLDLTQNLQLSNLDCSENLLTELNLFTTLMFEIKCNDNNISELDFSNITFFGDLECQNNNLTILNLKNGNDYPTSGEELSNINFSGNTNLEYICADDFELDQIIGLTNTYGYTNCHVNSYCSFTPGGTFYEISGNTKYDFNSNGCDISDINYPNLNLSITDGTNTGSLISNQTGNYYIPVQAGNHTITPILENPTYFNISPLSFVANFPTQASPFAQDFCITANGIHHDVEVILIPTVPARPGFDATYKLVYRNKGNQVENGTVSLTFDDARLDYVSSNPVYDSSATNSFTWNYVNLQPFETREIILTFNVNSPMETPAVNNGDVLNYTTTITTVNTDQTPADNTFTLDQTVVGSYDPNDKTCLEGTTITPSEVGKYVHYVIRFENTGTFPAENIVVKDMIDFNMFDIATLVPLKSSHDFFTRISGNKVEFIFENINLDFNDATNDGYVVFKIKTKPTLVVGNTFTNNANIYFDYNFPITTNTYTTTVAALSTQDFDFGTYFTLYPNPAKDILNIQTKQDVAINSIEIYNQLGQIVMATTNAINSVDVTNLTSGTYFVKVNTEKGSANAKFVKE